MRPCTHVHTHLLPKPGMVAHAYNQSQHKGRGGRWKKGWVIYTQGFWDNSRLLRVLHVHRHIYIYIVKTFLILPCNDFIYYYAYFKVTIKNWNIFPALVFVLPLLIYWRGDVTSTFNILHMLVGFMSASHSWHYLRGRNLNWENPQWDPAVVLSLGRWSWVLQESRQSTPWGTSQ